MIVLLIEKIGGERGKEFFFCVPQLYLWGSPFGVRFLRILIQPLREGAIDRGCGYVASRGATRGVTVSMSAFLACHQCYCAGSSLAWGLNLWAVVCGIF